MAEIRQIAASRRFRVVLSILTALGAAFNVGLAVLCFRFTRGRPEGLRMFALLMGAYFVYSHVLPKLLPSESGISTTVAAAWGVGNMGMSLMLVTYYWLWGPILAAAGARRRNDRAAEQ
jgi:hypothetical protein